MIASKNNFLILELLSPNIESRICVKDIFDHPWVKKYETKISKVKSDDYSNTCYNATQDTFKNKESTMDNTSFLDATMIKDQIMNDKLFDTVLGQIEKKKDRKRNRSCKLIMDTMDSNENKNKNKIVLKIEKAPTKERNKSMERLSSIRAVGEEQMSMLRDIREIDRQIDEKNKEIARLNKKTSKFMTKLDESNTINNNEKYKYNGQDESEDEEIFRRQDKKSKKRFESKEKKRAEDKENLVRDSNATDYNDEIFIRGRAKKTKLAAGKNMRDLNDELNLVYTNKKLENENTERGGCNFFGLFKCG